MNKGIEEKIRGKQVMLDKDIAGLYSVKARALRQQVKRNLRRFPPDFMFTLRDYEVGLMVSQSVTPSRKYFGGHLPYAFTQEGIAMLSSVLRSCRAIDVNIAIMRAFVRLRHAMLSSREVARRVEKIEGEVNVLITDVRLIYQDVQDLKKKPAQPEPPGTPKTII